MIVNIGGFVFCAVLITLSGTQLSRYGNRLAELTGLSKAWIGLILMATVTSLPELVTGLASVVVVDAPDLAMGNVLGSCAFNLFILSLLDMMVKKPITSLVQTSHVIAGAFSIILLAIVAIALVLAPGTGALLWISPFSVLILFVYALSMRSIFLYDKAHPVKDEIKHDSRNADEKGLKYVLSVYSAHALVVVGAALFLPYFGDTIAEKSGMSDTFFGTIFMAVTTSLPELVISFSAVRIGAIDMAMGNLFGSNVFNIAILSVIDFFYTPAPFFQAISPTHILSILACIIMTAVTAIGLVVKPEKKKWRLSVDSLIILTLYVLILILLE